jgi:transketolase
METAATREGYGKGLLKVGSNEKVVALDADLSESTKSSLFAEKYPDRFFDLGISEADMVGTAAGLAACGKIAFASSFAVFATGLAYNQIRQSVCYSNTNVRVVGSHAGLATGEDGATHQSLEDISLMRGLPNMVVISPADAVEAEKAVEALVDYEGPVYLRVARAKTPILFDENYKFEIGKGVILEDGDDVTLIATGVMVVKALEVAKELKQNSISSRVINIHTIKPIDKDLIIDSVKKTGCIVTLEDHSIIGGLGSAVSEVLTEDEFAPLERIGVRDKFGESGKPDDLYKKYKMTNEDIIKAVNKVIERKGGNK